MGLFDDVPDAPKPTGLFDDVPDAPKAGQPLDFLATDSPPSQMTGQLPSAQPLRAPEMLPTPGFGGQVRQALSETYSVNPQQFSDARDVVLHPFDLARPSTNPTWIDKALGGAQKATIDTTAGTFTDPIALGAMATGLGPVQKILGVAAPLVGRAITGYFAGSMATGTPEVYRNVRDAFVTGDTEQISKAVTGAAMGVAMLLGVGKHAVRGGVKGVQEEWAAAMSKRPDFQEAVKAEAMKQPVAVDQPSQTGVPALDEVNAQLEAKNLESRTSLPTPALAPIAPKQAESLSQEHLRTGRTRYLTPAEIEAGRIAALPPAVVPVKPVEAPPLPAPLPVKPVEQPVPVESNPVEPALVAEVTPDQTYDSSLATFRLASKEFTKATADYRSKKIGDTEFLAARAKIEEAKKVSDAAETAFIDAKNAKPIAPQPAVAPEHGRTSALSPKEQLELNELRQIKQDKGKLATGNNARLIELEASLKGGGTVEVARVDQEDVANWLVDLNVNNRSYKKIGEEYVVYSDLPEATKATTTTTVAPEPTATKPVAKEPWMLTQSEFVARHKAIDAAWQLDKSKPSTSSFGTFHGKDYQKYLDGDKYGGKVSDLTYEQQKHKSEVVNAIREGKPVPAEVLADYPDLKPVGAENAQTAVKPDEILIQKTAKAAANTSKWPKKEAPDGYEMTFKPYGKEGAGYYFVKKPSQPAVKIEASVTKPGEKPPKVGNESAIPTAEETARWNAVDAYTKPLVSEMTGERLDALGVKVEVKRSGLDDAKYQEKILANTHPDDLLAALPDQKSAVSPIVEPPSKSVVKDSLTTELPAKPDISQPATFADHRAQWDNMKNPPTKEEAIATIDANDNAIAKLTRDQSAAKSAKKKANIQAQIETLAQESDALAAQHDITFKTPLAEAPAAAPVEAPTVKSATEEMAATKPARKTRWTKTAEGINPTAPARSIAAIEKDMETVDGTLLAIGEKLGEIRDGVGFGDSGMQANLVKQRAELKAKSKVLEAEHKSARSNPMGDLTKEVGAGIPNPVTVAKAAWQAGKNVKAAVGPFAKEVVGEQFRINRVTDQRRSVLKWSGTMQKAYDEAAQAKLDITESVPDPVKREGITNWIQAGGDRAVLQDRANRTADPKLKAGYEAALNLTPEELTMAQEVRDTFDAMEQHGRANDVLNAHRDNYVPQIWDMGKGPAVASSRMLRDKFKFAKERKLDSFFEGEQAGYVPKTKDISDLVPIYTHEMNSVIAAKQLVRDLSAGTATDGRPLVSVRGGGVPVSNVEYMVINDTTGRTVRKFETQAEADAAVGAGQSVQERLNQATIVLPKMPAKDTMDYTTMEKQPALQGWKYTTADSAGNPVLVKGDIALHPEATRQLKAVLGRSEIKNWYDIRTTASAEFLKKPVHFVDWAQSETKKTMLGLLAPFHQVQEGTHAIGHRVNPFAVTKGGFFESKTGLKSPEFMSIPKIDLVNDAAQADAAVHGLMLQPDRASANQFMEGFKQSGLVKRIPVIGPLADRYQTYLFHQYIPGLKFKTWTAMVERNSKVYAKELTAGQVTPEDIKVLSSEQANAAYGHMNYADLGRSPTIQHILQLGLLAPDFLEARGRFSLQGLKGATGAKVGQEQMVAIAFLAASQAALMYSLAKLTGGEWDPKDPFVMRNGARTYGGRSVPEDDLRIIRGVYSMFSKNDDREIRAFAMGRINPTVGKAILQGSTGRDYRGQKISPGETAKEILWAPMPLTVRPLMDRLPDSVREAPGLKYLLPTKKVQTVSPLDQFAGTMGLKVGRYYPEQNVRTLHDEWMKNNPDPKIKASYDEKQKQTFGESKYRVLDMALDDRKEAEVKTAIKELTDAGLKKDDIRKRMNPWTGGTYPAPKPLFHEKAEYERKFVAGLTTDQKVVYDAAKKDRLEKWTLFLKVFNQK